MAHPNITWYCAECGWKRAEVHTCPPDSQQTIAKLVDLLPRNAPAPPVLAEIERLGELRRQHNFDAIEVSDTTLQWLLAAFSHLEAARELLAPYREGR